MIAILILALKALTFLNLCNVGIWIVNKLYDLPNRNPLKLNSDFQRQQLKTFKQFVSEYQRDKNNEMNNMKWNNINITIGGIPAFTTEEIAERLENNSMPDGRFYIVEYADDETYEEYQRKLKEQRSKHRKAVIKKLLSE